LKLGNFLYSFGFKAGKATYISYSTRYIYGSYSSKSA
jgi:hypothetical protein